MNITAKAILMICKRLPSVPINHNLLNWRGYLHKPLQLESVEQLSLDRRSIEIKYQSILMKTKGSTARSVSQVLCRPECKLYAKGL